jgi:Family of unknown function (DUF6069)/Porin subfamily
MKRLVVGDDRSQSTLFPERLGDFLSENTTFATAAGIATGVYGAASIGGAWSPDLVGQVRVDQAWGLFQASIAAHDNHATYYIDPTMPLDTLSVGPISVFTIGGVIGATVVYALMRRLLNSPDFSFVVIAIVVLVLSFIPDYLIIGQTTGRFAGANWGSALVLMLMHLVEAFIVVWALIKLWGHRPLPSKSTSI